VLTDTPNARRRLWTVAGTLAARGPIAAYRQLADPRDARLRWLGPAFGTKFLYFCQPAGIHQQALILDETVATWLHRELGLDLQPTRWSVSSYSSYLDLFGRWAAELECAPEDIEYCIFQAMADERGTQWAR